MIYSLNCRRQLYLDSLYIFYSISIISFWNRCLNKDSFRLMPIRTYAQKISDIHAILYICSRYIILPFCMVTIKINGAWNSVLQGAGGGWLPAEACCVIHSSPVGISNSEKTDRSWPQSGGDGKGSSFLWMQASMSLTEGEKYDRAK